jgi:hypothetical protein
MTPLRSFAIASSAIVLVACASGSTNRPAGPSQLVDVTLQPARISPNPSGAFRLSEVTGCYVEFVGRGPAEPTFQFRIAPTQRMPSLEQCIESLRTQPGVTAGLLP